MVRQYHTFVVSFSKGTICFAYGVSTVKKLDSCARNVLETASFFTFWEMKAAVQYLFRKGLSRPRRRPPMGLALRGREGGMLSGGPAALPPPPNIAFSAGLVCIEYSRTINRRAVPLPSSLPCPISQFH